MKMKKNLTGYPSIDKPQNNGYSFMQKHPYIPNLSVYEAIYLLNYFYKEKEAIDCLDLSVSYGEMFEDSVTISKALKELGVRKGDIIVISMPNYYQAVSAFMACNRIGAITTFLNPSASKEEITEHLNMFESPILINYDKSEEQNDFYKKNSKLNYIITLNKKNINNKDLGNDYHITSKDKFLDFNSLGTISAFQRKGIPTGNGNSDSLILYTSGSTGKPKAVVLTNKNIISAGIYLKNSSKSKELEGDRTLVCVPFMYPYGFSTSTLMTLMSNKTAILAPNMSKDTISYYLSKNPNIIFGSPALLDLIMKNTPSSQDLSSIRHYISGGDFLTPSHSSRGKQFFEEHGAKNVEMGNGSGNAETVSCGTNPCGIEIRPKTAGKVLVGTKAIIVDPETLEEKKYGEEGLMCVSGKHVFKGYYNAPDKTKKAKFTKNGVEYFKTGTMGFIDKDGYFTLTGRQSRFYIISTLNKVYCDKIQSLISNLECVDDCAVVKVSDEDMLYSNTAFIVLNSKFEATEEQKEAIIELLKQPVYDSNGNLEQLSWYEIPKYIEFVEEIPKREGTKKTDYTLLESKAEELKNQKQKKLVIE